MKNFSFFSLNLKHDILWLIARKLKTAAFPILITKKSVPSFYNTIKRLKNPCPSHLTSCSMWYLLCSVPILFLHSETPLAYKVHQFHVAKFIPSTHWDRFPKTIRSNTLSGFVTSFYGIELSVLRPTPLTWGLGNFWSRFSSSSLWKANFIHYNAVIAVFGSGRYSRYPPHSVSLPLSATWGGTRWDNSHFQYSKNIQETTIDFWNDKAQRENLIHR